jgi:hypothetical protein
MSLPTFAQSHFDDKTRVFLDLKGAPGPGGVAFDSSLKPSHTPAHNHTLEIHLKMFLDKFNPPAYHPKAWIVTDWGGKPFIVGPWNHDEWVRFVQGYQQQVNMWNDKFWLTPPVGFDRLDIKSGAHTIRPNVYCHLNVELVGSAAQAHKRIRVVNLDAKFAAAMYGGTESDINSLTFRSDSGNYDTFDARKGKVAQSTIAHEIGHAIGEDHIGVTLHDPSCEVAMLLDRHTPALAKPFIPAAFRDGIGSLACYGQFSDPNLSANIMGFGNSFDKVNAKPWVDCIALHTLFGNWEVSMGRVAPKMVP